MFFLPGRVSKAQLKVALFIFFLGIGSEITPVLGAGKMFMTSYYEL